MEEWESKIHEGGQRLGTPAAHIKDMLAVLGDPLLYTSQSRHPLLDSIQATLWTAREKLEEFALLAQADNVNATESVRCGALLHIGQRSGRYAIPILEGIASSLNQSSEKVARLARRAIQEIYTRCGSEEHLEKPGAKGAQAEGTKFILYLAANPLTAERLKIEEEAQEIHDLLNETPIGQKHRLISRVAANKYELSALLLKYKPTIVHFSAHGASSGDLILEDPQGNAQQLSIERLARLFEAVAGHTECIVLSACHTAERAELLAMHAGCVIGMSKEIGDDSARCFARGFYRGLAYQKTYEQAFAIGSAEIGIANLPDALAPTYTFRSQTGEIEWRNALDGNRRVMRSFHSDPTLLAEQDQGRLFPVWFGTNRAPVDASDVSLGFTADRDTGIHYGVCNVGIPKWHRMGEVASAWWKRLLGWKNGTLSVDQCVGMTEAEFWSTAVAHSLNLPDGKGDGLVFIHGYNVTFENAAIRAAQLGFDLDFEGITAFFSWPSRGTVEGYGADAASVEASEPFIREFLTKFALREEIDRVHIIAHSMGNRVLLRVMQSIAAEAASLTNKPFGQIILAAPDVDRDVFECLARAYSLVSERTTLYASNKDSALEASGTLHCFARAGLLPPITRVEGVDTIEVSGIDLSFLGHGYYGAARPVLYDMYEMLRNDVSPDKRAGIRGEGPWYIAP